MNKQANNRPKDQLFKAAWALVKKGHCASFPEALKEIKSWEKRKAATAFVKAYKVVDETEKSIRIGSYMVCEGSEEKVDSDFWIPKSVLTEDGGIPSWIYAARIAKVIQKRPCLSFHLK